MVRINNLRKHEEAVLDLIFCSECHSPMVIQGDCFVCPNNQDSAQESCQLLPTKADTLITRIVNQLMERVLPEPVLRSLLDEMDHQLTVELDTLVPHPQWAEVPLSMARAERERLRQVVQDRPGTPEEVTELAEVEARIETLEAEKLGTVQQTYEYSWLRDNKQLRQTAKDPKTYLDYADPADTQQLLAMFVEKVRVGNSSFHMDYRLPLADSNNRATVTSEELKL